jgi:glycosyltransferase involved in cell wall biosynthesis
MTEKHLIILGIRGVPAAHGGFETFAERLSVYLHHRGWRITVYCQVAGGEQREDDWEGIRRVHVPTTLSGALGTVEFDAKCVKDVAKYPGTILTLGYNTGFLSAWLRLRGRTNHINMDGLEWQRAKYSLIPRVYLWLNERIAAMAGSRLIADHPAIADHLATRVSRTKIDMIPYGSDPIDSSDPTALAQYGLERDRYFTLIARPEPENSILEIVRAFGRAPSGYKLAVLGNYDPDVPYQRAVLKAAGTKVMFLGAIYEKEQLAALRAFSTAYLHGHQVGGTNPSLVEALGAGNAVIAHDNRFNRWVAGDAALYFSDIEGCAEQISHLSTDLSLRARLSSAASERWEATFTWDAVLENYERVLTATAVRT